MMNNFDVLSAAIAVQVSCSFKSQKIVSQQQSYSEYFYFTITQDNEQNVQQIVEQYHLDRMCGYEAWNKGQISDDGTHQFQQMYIRFDINQNLNNLEQIQHWFTYL